MSFFSLSLSLSLSLSQFLSAAFRFWLSHQKLNSICFWSVTSVGENKEKANTIQPPPPLCFSHLQLCVKVIMLNFLLKMMKSVVVVDCWWNHKMMIELLLNCVVNASTCLRYWYIWSCGQIVVFFLWIFEKIGDKWKM